jgi:hypothetical protein
MSSGAIAIVNPGQVMAPDYMKELLEFYNKGGSMTVADAKQGLVTENLKGSELASAIEAADKNLSDRFRCYYVTDEHKVNAERQPFPVIVNSNNKPLVYALIEGNFEKYATDEATMGPEATFFEEWLANKIQAVWTGCGGNVKKLFQLLDTNKFKTEVQEEMGTRGVIALMNNTEAPIWISKGNSDEAGKFTWGEVSNKLTYVEPKAKLDKPTKVDFSKMTYKERKQFLEDNPDYDTDAEPASTEEQPPPSADKPTSVPTVVPADAEVEKVTDTGSIAIKKHRRYLYPPAGLGLEDRKKWYGKHGGSSKDYDWKNSVGIPIDKIVKSSHFYAMVHGPGTKDTDAHGQIEKIEYPILTGPEIGEAFSVIKASTGYATLDELNVTLNDEHPAFTSRMNKTLDDYPLLLRMKYSDLLKLSHKALANLCHELRIAYLKDNPAAFGATHVEKQLKITETPKPEKVEVPAGGSKIDLSSMTYKERKKYLEDHPEAAAAA